MTDQTQTTTEPVAWRFKLPGNDEWEVCQSDPRCDTTDFDDVQPLYTTPQPLAIGLDREAVARVERFLAEWAKGKHYTDLVYGLHTGTDREAELTVTDLRSLLAIAAPAEVNGHVASALLWFGSQHNLELSYGYEVDGEGGDGWQVHSVNGGRNDREWTRLSFGHDTPIKAIAACLPAAPTGEGK